MKRADDYHAISRLNRHGVRYLLIGGQAMRLEGMPRFSAETRAVSRVNENGTAIRCLATADLLASKRAANRPVDQADILFLEAKLAG